MMPYSSRLKYISDWFVQLWAESLGKNEDLQGNHIHVGPTPLKALGATDQHSQIQLFNEGPNDKLINFIRVENFDTTLEIPKIFEYTGNILGEAFADFTVFSSPEAIILFGGLAKSGDLLMRPLRESMEKNMLHIFKGKVKVIPSELKEADAAVLGASALGWEAGKANSAPNPVAVPAKTNE